jgi:tRNA (guanine10-N2)-dimethyltransferase
VPGVSVSPPARAQAVLLSGEHPTLPLAELRALLAMHDPHATAQADGVVAVVQPGDLAATKAALARMALAHEWGDLWATAPETEAGLHRLAVLVPAVAPRVGSVAVASERRGTAKTLERAQVERQLGAVLKGNGLSVDLKAPTHVVFAWLADGRIVLGRRGGRNDRSSHEARVSDERAHFSPVSLHPRRAASLLHLARVPPGGRVLDPFCGTGGLVLEAALEGYDAWGSDIDPFMVQGTLQTLADHGEAALAGTALQADIADVPGLVGQVDGIVTDFPYGRASSSHDEELAGLYDRAFAAFAKLLPEGGHAVVGCAQPEMLPDLAKHGFAEVERHVERVHKSLTRHYVVVRRLP